MAVQGPFQVGFDHMFPLGLYAVGGVLPLFDFGASSKENKVQQRDRDTGLPMWTVDAIDSDPEAREHSFKVKVIADHPPVLPDPAPGSPFIPIALEGLSVTPYLKETGTDEKTGQIRYKIAYSLRATGVTAARPRPVNGKDA